MRLCCQLQPRVNSAPPMLEISLRPPSLRSFTRFNGGSTERGGEESRGMTTELWTFAFAPMWTIRQIWKRERGKKEGRKAKADVEAV